MELNKLFDLVWTAGNVNFQRVSVATPAGAAAAGAAAAELALLFEYSLQLDATRTCHLPGAGKLARGIATYSTGFTGHTALHCTVLCYVLLSLCCDIMHIWQKKQRGYIRRTWWNI